MRIKLKKILIILFISNLLTIVGFAENNYVRVKSLYPEVTEDLRDPFWRPDYRPGEDNTVTTEIKIIDLPPEAFRISGISGALGTPNVTVTMNKDIIVDVDEEFAFEYKGKTFMLKVIEANDDFIVIDNAGEKITIPFGKTDATP